MNIPMYKGEEEILVHPSKVEWMEQNGWSVEKQAEIELSNKEVKENGGD